MCLLLSAVPVAASAPDRSSSPNLYRGGAEMRLHIVSDLHLEFGSFALPETDSDVLVLAGDIALHTHGIEWAASVARDRPVIYVAGNHEFYSSHLSGLAAQMRKRADELGVHLLDNDEVIIGSVRFLGTTLWTDFQLYGAGAAAIQAMNAADRYMTDFKLIRYGGKRLFTARDSARIHHASVQWLRQRLAVQHDGPTVVVTHHCPHPRSTPERFVGDNLTPAFCSDLSSLIEEFQPNLWVHGHTHDSYNYVVGKTQVVCNPRGYVGREVNTDFRPDLVVELSPASFVWGKAP